MMTGFSACDRKPAAEHLKTEPVRQQQHNLSDTALSLIFVLYDCAKNRFAYFLHSCCKVISENKYTGSVT